MNKDPLENEPIDYQTTLYRIRDVLGCGHVKNCYESVYMMSIRLDDALGKIATLERELLEIKNIKSLPL